MDKNKLKGPSAWNFKTLRTRGFLQISRKETKQSKTKYIDHIKNKGGGGVKYL